ncbi:MAG: methyltransferase domain-containing protein [Gemmatimonadaceae bacterium]
MSGLEGQHPMLLSRKTKYLILGLGSFVPGYRRLPILSKAAAVSTGGTDSARYCYSVWLRHLVKAHEHGLPTNPAAVAELGPGDSIGVGLAALLSGAKTYYACDAVTYLHNTRNLQVFDELVELFGKRENIPDNREFPEVRPVLSSYEFPSGALADAHLCDCLRRERTESIREELLDFKRAKQRFIFYAAPWDEQTVVRPNSIDMVYSQAVLEHVNDLEVTYQSLFVWLKPGGIMSHVIDFRCHGCAEQWNGHWSYSDLTWKLIRGKRSWLINRASYNSHLALLREHGFDVVYGLREPATRSSGIDRSRLAPAFRDISDEDLQTSLGFIQAVKK